MSNWEKPLSAKQVSYAAGDALAGLIAHLEMAERVKSIPVEYPRINIDKRMVKEAALAKKESKEKGEALKRKRDESQK
jgi:hypothetical protein